MSAVASIDYAALGEPALLECMRQRDPAAFRHLMTLNNQRLFRTARAFMSSDAEAEDVVQQAYLSAFESLPSFRGDATLSTWLVRIVANEARQRLRDRKQQVSIDVVEQEPPSATVLTLRAADDPAADTARAELRHLLEQAIGELSPDFRAVLILRDIEECSVDETATLLGIKPETVKTRLHRARRFLRSTLERRVAASLDEAFQFRGDRCARIVQAVINHPRMRNLLAQR